MALGTAMLSEPGQSPRRTRMSPDAHSTASAPRPSPVLVVAGADRFGEQRPLGIGEVTFKVVPQDGSGLLIVENIFHAMGGPARHLHYDQDEWFYALEGEFLFEVGQERFSLHPGDSLLVPRQV